MSHKARSLLMIRLAIVFGMVLALGPVASAEWKEKVLYSFQGGTDGTGVVGAVVFGPDGSLYGATQFGGADNCSPMAACGTVYQVTPQKDGSWTETVLYVFKGKASNDGEYPEGGLVVDSLGNLYGTAAYGGTGSCVLLGIKGGCGTVFELSPPQQQGGVWTETILYSFQGGNDGYVPAGDLVLDRAGNLYGATLFGGGKGTTCDPFYQYCGTVFKLSRPKKKGGKWTEQVLHSFAGGTDGASPNGGLALGSTGAIYGTTPIGGSQSCSFGNGNCGIVFRLSPPIVKGGPWVERTLHGFTGRNDGGGPNGGLIFDAGGRLYGSAGGGDAAGCGVVYRMTPDGGGGWAEAVLYGFTCGNDGQGPAPLILDKLGNLYGTSIGGPLHAGLVFRLRPPVGIGALPWAFQLLYSFQGVPDCDHPSGAPLALTNSGALYGAAGGGKANQGCVFEVWP